MKTDVRSNTDPEKIIILSTLCLLFGRAWQHLFWDAPFRTFLWDQDYMENIILSFTRFETWNKYVTSPISDQWIDRSIIFVGVVFFISFLLLFFYKRPRRLLRSMLTLSALLLTILTICYWKEKFYQVGQLIEYSSQVICPFLVIYILFKKVEFIKLIIPIKIAIALTFIGHGLYAIGFHPQPGYFVDMILNIFPISEPAAKSILHFAGVLDFIAAILLFIPTTFRWALWYIFIWAVLTSMARIVSHIDLNQFISSTHQWFFEVLIRVPHFGLPLSLLILNKRLNK